MKLTPYVFSFLLLFACTNNSSDDATGGSATGGTAGSAGALNSGGNVMVGGGGSSSTPTCPDRSGLYRTEFTEIEGGTCGPLPAEVQSITPGPSDIQPGCEGTYEVSEDNCTETFEYTCTALGYAESYSGTTVWKDDAAVGEVDVVVTVDDEPACQSMYSYVTFKNK